MGKFLNTMRQDMKRDWLLIWDLETTSAEPATARVVQLAAVLYTSNTTQTLFNCYCKPPVDISDGAAAVHGISAADVINAESDHSTLSQLADFIEANQARLIMAGHNLMTFDKVILETITGRNFKVPVIDTLVCATRTLPLQPSHKLSNLVKSLNLDSGEGAHDALADVMMVKKLIDYFSSGLMRGWEDLADWCAEPRILTIMPFGKFKGKKFGKAGPGENSKDYVPWFYIDFMRNDFTNPSHDLVATLDHYYGVKFLKTGAKKNDSCISAV